MRVANILVACSVIGLCACSVDEAVDTTAGVTPGFDDAAQQELIDQGVGKYLGKFQPTSVETYEDTTTYTYTAAAAPNGPMCMKGGDFKVFARNTGSDNLVIYLQGGGACWSDLCAATTTTAGGIQPLGWTDGNTEVNPVGSWNVVFVSYCDGSVFSGDSDVADTKNGGADGFRHHHGLANLSAGLDVALMNFPAPRKILLSGSSAGGYGTLIGTVATRLAYPHTPLYVINDAGLGLTNPDDPEKFNHARAEWKIDQFIPNSCPGCTTGQFTSLISWALAHDPTLKVGGTSSYEDVVIGNGFLGMEGPAFKQLLLEQTAIVHDAYPKRFERYFIAGSQHTLVLSFYADGVNGVSMPEWTRRLVTDSPTWTDEMQEDPP